MGKIESGLDRYHVLNHRNNYVLAGLAALIVGVVLAGCSSGDESSSEDPVVLSYQDWRTDWFPPMAQELLD